MCVSMPLNCMFDMPTCFPLVFPPVSIFMSLLFVVHPQTPRVNASPLFPLFCYVLSMPRAGEAVEVANLAPTIQQKANLLAFVKKFEEDHRRHNRTVHLALIMDAETTDWFREKRLDYIASQEELQDLQAEGELTEAHPATFWFST